MERYFNVAGPCFPQEHYMLAALERLPEVETLIARRQYFVIHAARQSGKTTLLKALVEEVNAGRERVAVYCSLECVQGISDAERGVPSIVDVILNNIVMHPAVKAKPLPQVDRSAFAVAVNQVLRSMAGALDKPLVMLFDEADCLSGQTLISFLRQLREGYVNRNEMPFPSSVALVGMRNLRDYKAQIRPDAQTLGSASPFNIVTEALTLTNFTREQIGALYAQHTQATGQVFEETAVDCAFHWTCGQPWLVNALARECVDKILKGDTTRPVTAALIDEAAQTLLRRRDTHIDSLLERLKEPRVRAVVEPVILGDEPVIARKSDDCQFVLDLGLLKESGGTLLPSNPIYAEMMVRALAYDTQENMKFQIKQTPWLSAEGLDMNGMLRAFQGFWRENSEAWVARYDFQEAAPHIVLQAFLQRVINGGGQIVREYALGRGRMDLLVCLGSHRYALELKMRHQYRPAEDHDQFLAYLERLGLDEGWMPIFDRDPKKTWDEKLFWKTIERDGRKIHIVGL